MTGPLALKVWGMSEVGRVRSQNEDSVAWDVAHGMVILADGMGGHSAGDVASQMATSGFIDRLDQRRPGSLGPEHLKDMANQVNMAIYRHAQDRPGGEKMGATVALLYLSDQAVVIGHAGDSRVYQVRGTDLIQLTEDHSLVQQLVDDGALSPEEALISRYKNVVTRALGVRPEVDIQMQQQPAKAGDRFLLCSDGLTNMLSIAEISAVIDAYGSGEQNR